MAQGSGHAAWTVFPFHLSDLAQYQPFQPNLLMLNGMCVAWQPDFLLCKLICPLHAHIQASPYC